MRITRVGYNGRTWVTVTNLWICDEAHLDTCHYNITLVKPTERQVRKFKKNASAYFRKGTRAKQREQQASLRSL